MCVVGDFEKDALSDIQINSLVTVLTDWCKSYKLNESSIYGHFNAPGGSTKTRCPGKNLKNRLPVIKQKVAANLK